VIVILISVPFALWGIQSYLGVGGERAVAVVDGVEITAREFDYRYRDFMARLQERLGDAYRPELFEDMGMRGKLLDDLIREKLLLASAHDLGLAASDRELGAMIWSAPAFQKDGVFDKGTYERMLRLKGMVPAQYEEELRREIVRSQLARALLATERLTDKEIQEAVRLERQQRRLALVRVPKAAYLGKETIAEEDVSAYYAANQARFEIPERVRVQYLVLDADSIAPSDEEGKGFSDEDLRARYQAEIERFTHPERRRVRHLLVTLDPGVDEAEEDSAKARLLAVRERIQAGEDFGDLARALSQDPGSAPSGGDLGLIERGMMDPAFDEAAFTLALNQVSEPVRTRFGYHLMEVTEIEEGKVEPFENVKGELLADLQADAGREGLYYDSVERLANLTYESPDTLARAAETLDLDLQTSGWLDRQSGGDGLFAEPVVIAAAFSEEVLREGKNSEILEPDPNRLQAIVLRVIDHQEAAAKPLDEVRDEILDVLRDQHAAQDAAAEASALVDALRAGGALAAVASDYEIEEIGPISRNATDLPADVRDYAFTLERNANGASYGSLSASDGDGIVVVVREVVDGSFDDISEADRERIVAGWSQAIGRGYYDSFVADLRGRVKIERRLSDEQGQDE